MGKILTKILNKFVDPELKSNISRLENDVNMQRVAKRRLVDRLKDKIMSGDKSGTENLDSATKFARNNIDSNIKSALEDSKVLKGTKALQGYLVGGAAGGTGVAAHHVATHKDNVQVAAEKMDDATNTAKKIISENPGKVAAAAGAAIAAGLGAKALIKKLRKKK